VCGIPNPGYVVADVNRPSRRYSRLSSTPAFSGSSFGFRPGRSAHQAVRVARRCIQDGLEWVVDIDLDQFFDRVQFDVLLARVRGAGAVPYGRSTGSVCAAAVGVAE
jgi:hypothetical protein